MSNNHIPIKCSIVFSDTGHSVEDCINKNFLDTGVWIFNGQQYVVDHVVEHDDASATIYAVPGTVQIKNVIEREPFKNGHIDIWDFPNSSEANSAPRSTR